MQIHRRYALPMAPMLFALIGVPLAMRLTRGGRSWGVLLCAGLVGVYYGVLTFSQYLALAGRDPGRDRALDPERAVRGRGGRPARACAATGGLTAAARMASRGRGIVPPPRERADFKRIPESTDGAAQGSSWLMLDPEAREQTQGWGAELRQRLGVPALAAVPQPAVADRDLGLLRGADHVARRVVDLDPFDRVVPAREDRREVSGAAARHQSAPRSLLRAAPARRRDLRAQRRRHGELRRARGARGASASAHGAADLPLVRARAVPAIRGALRARPAGSRPCSGSATEIELPAARARAGGADHRSPRWAGSSGWAGDACSSRRPRC